jgi:hypothetical protein
VAAVESIAEDAATEQLEDIMGVVRETPIDMGMGAEEKAAA